MSTLSKELPPQAPPSTAADESVKRNTDCVYFLASPLTCKKGSECEFRHSESARTNPRDCFYWLNKSCLNPKCAFRHPPLDGLVVPQAGNVTGPSPLMPPSLPAKQAVPSVPTKQAVPCIYFQQGFCLKGDRCPFLHGPVPPPNTKIWSNPATNAAIEVPMLMKNFGGPEMLMQTKTDLHATKTKAAEVPRQPQKNEVPKVASARLMDGGLAVKRYPPPGVVEEIPKYKQSTHATVDNRSLRSRAARLHHTSSVNDKNHPNRRDFDDSLRESSPGFDVLVDYKLRKDEYHHDEDNMRMRSREGRIDEVCMSHHGHYNSTADVDLDNYRSKHSYNSYNGLQDEYARTQRGASSERLTAHERSSVIQNSSDLRHRLSKQRRGNDLRSVISPNYKPDDLPEDRGYRSFQRDVHSPTRRDRSRLQGRIKLPRISPDSPPLSGGGMYSETNNEKGRNLDRSSPRGPHVSYCQGRLLDRLSRRVQDETIEGRASRGQIRKDSTIQASGPEFTAPKISSGGKIRDTVLAGSLGTEGDISFDGPKPLSEILKRKRKSGVTASTKVVNIDNKEQFKKNNNHVNFISSTTNSAAGTEKQVTLSLASEETQGDAVQENNKPVNAEGDEEGEISHKKVKMNDDESSLPDDQKHLDAEEGLFDGDGEEHEADEEYDEGDGEYEYEQDDDLEDYNFDEGEVYEGDAGHYEDDLMDEDYEDDFAKKLGVSV